MQDHLLEMTQKETKPRLTSISALGEENRLKSLRKIEDKKKKLANDCLNTSKIPNGE